MGKGKKNNKAKANNSKKGKETPFVSICTPTYNRRPFIPWMIKCFDHQTYPKENMEWIIIDDGTDKIGDLVKDVPQVKYFSYDEKMPLGKKRNIMHEKSKGDIIVYMDDDDYYPPMRVSHAVDMLTSHKNALCAGSSEIYIYFKHIEKMYQFGPYGPNHATAGTFAFKRALLEQCNYENHACLAEEKAFLKNYTIPFVQLEPKKTILVFSHRHNTFDKRKLLDNPHPKFVKESDRVVDEFVKEAELKDFYMNEVDGILCNYKPGEPTMKPDVLQQMVEIEETRRKHMENIANKHQQEGQIMVTNNTGESKALNNQQVVSIIREQQGKLKEYETKLNDANRQFQEMNIKIQQQHGIIQHLQTQNKEYLEEIVELKNEIKTKKKEAETETKNTDSNIVDSENLELEVNM